MEGVTETDPVRVDSLITRHFKDWSEHKEMRLAEDVEEAGGTMGAQEGVVRRSQHPGPIPVGTLPAQD